MKKLKYIKTFEELVDPNGAVISSVKTPQTQTNTKQLVNTSGAAISTNNPVKIKTGTPEETGTPNIVKTTTPKVDSKAIAKARQETDPIKQVIDKSVGRYKNLANLQILKPKPKEANEF